MMDVLRIAPFWERHSRHLCLSTLVQAFDFLSVEKCRERVRARRVVSGVTTSWTLEHGAPAEIALGGIDPKLREGRRNRGSIADNLEGIPSDVSRTSLN